jgi:transcriptional regulator with XRE-family HTH domain
MISAGQIRAARALLGWSQDDLAAATNLSVSTVRNLESGDMSPRSATASEIRRVIEQAGLEFIEPDGIRRRIDEVTIYRGRDSCDSFFGDVTRTVKEKGGAVLSIFKSTETFAQLSSLTRDRCERLEQLSAYAEVKCLLSEMPKFPLAEPSFEHRIILKQHIGPVSYFVYGNKYAIVLTEGSAAFRFVVFDSLTLAQNHRSHFFSLWELAPPIFAQVKAHLRVPV